MSAAHCLNVLQSHRLLNMYSVPIQQSRDPLMRKTGLADFVPLRMDAVMRGRGKIGAGEVRILKTRLLPGWRIQIWHPTNRFV